MTDPAKAAWKTSSYSQPQGSQCVEVAGNLSGAVAVRDSKHRQAGTHTVGPAAWRAFVSAVRHDRL